MEADGLRQNRWMDEIKTTALGAARKAFLDRIETLYRPGPTSHMAPGSLEDWPIGEQSPLFSLFGDVESLIGVTLKDSFLMVPIKSVSGILFPTEVKFESCQLCPREGCPGRRAAFDEHGWDQYK